MLSIWWQYVRLKPVTIAQFNNSRAAYWYFLNYHRHPFPLKRFGLLGFIKWDSELDCWICVDHRSYCSGYLYAHKTFLGIVRQILTEYGKDKHLVG